MKNIKKIIFASTFSLLFILNANSQEKPEVTLKVPASLYNQICPAPVWPHVTVLWKGVQDKRPSKALGTQTQKNNTIEVIANPPLADIINNEIRQLLTTCGMNIVTTGPEETTQLYVNINEFQAGVEKKMFMGKSTAKSQLSLTLVKSTETLTSEVGFEIENKRGKQKNLRQLESTLNDLLAGTLEQIPKVNQLREFKF